MSNAEHSDFLQQFKTQAQGLDDALSKVPNNKDVELLSLNVTKLRTYLTEAVTAGILPAYDQRLCEQRVASLEDSLSKARSASKPKSKFSFKSTANVRPAGASHNKGTRSAEQPAPTSGEASSTPGSSVKSSAAEITLINHNHRYLTLKNVAGAESLITTTPAQSIVITIKGLSNCFVNLESTGLLASVNAIHAHDLSRTVLYAGAVQGSILLHNCHECTIIVTVHQFRMHTSDSTHVYLKISSNPVIEKCTNIGFGSLSPPANTSLDNSNETTDSLPYTVQDFDWMGTAQSPNWQPIAPTDFQLPIEIPEDKLDSVLDTLLPQVTST